MNSCFSMPSPSAIHGKNFGYIEAPVSISIANVSCDNPAWGNDGQVTCQPQQDVVGYKNMTILAARQVRTRRGAPACQSALLPPPFSDVACRLLPSTSTTFRATCSSSARRATMASQASCACCAPLARGALASSSVWIECRCAGLPGGGTGADLPPLGRSSPAAAGAALLLALQPHRPR